MSLRIATSSLLLVLLIGLVGCGPRYRTYTSYHPPQDVAGRSCVTTCLDARALCRSERELREQQCRVDAREDAEAANNRAASEFQIDLLRYQAGMLELPPERPTPVQPNLGACSSRGRAIEAGCTQDFDLCYQNCGGKITHATHCVANCE